MALSEIVNVQISAQTTTVTQPGFGQLLFVGLHKRWDDLIRMYNNMQGVAADFQPTDPEYIGAQDFFSQTIVPPQLWIGRRTIDNATISVETAMQGFNYTTNINGTPYTVTATNNSTVVFSQAFVAGNFIKSSINGVVQGIITSLLTFNSNFVASNSTVVTVNGTPLTAVPFDTDNATTLADIATEIATAPGVASATASGAHVITVVFTAAGQNTVNSAVTTGGVSQSTVTINEGSINYTTEGSSAAMVTALAALWATNPAVASATVGGAGNLTITVIGNTAMNAVVNSALTTGGASQPTTTISYQTVVVPQMVALINGTPDPFVSATDNMNGSYGLTSLVAGTPWTLSVSTNIINPIQARVQINQTIPSQSYTVTINGNGYTYTAPLSVTGAEQVSLGLVALINGDPNASGIYSASDNGDGTFEVITANGNAFSIIVSQTIMSALIGLIISPYNTSTSISIDLTAMNDVNDGWYSLALTDRTQATVYAAATWAQSNTKLFGTASSDPDIINQSPGIDTTSIAYQLQIAGYERTFLLYHQDAGDNVLPGPGLDYPECAWFGAVLWTNPGSETWALKSLATIPYSDLTLTQSLNCRGKYANTYEYIGGVGVTRDGKVSANEYIDIVRGIDWLTSTVQTYVYSVLVNNTKVPYTDAGITAIQSQIQRALDQAVGQNFLSDTPYPSVSVPKAANVPAIDKTNRVLNNVTFQGTLAGAVQVVNIVGTVSV